MTNKTTRRTLSLALAAALAAGMIFATATVPVQAFSVNVPNSEGNESGEHKGSKQGKANEGDEHQDCAVTNKSVCQDD
jgi:hypothetical protein